jgi:hypothetical protein
MRPVSRNHLVADAKSKLRYPQRPMVELYDDTS